ncbi:TIGR02444 family protein [Alteromonas sp. 5E99-2]|uniref:TIGR02444 family protein n=1 Tax=Alteromonas sp. 5E99-2 TaxID=2817683 RepID=UPI001A989DE0|nr:TIGR02444 family protein [Alteromonas sp. 5E99-2]MBO1256846.1 TIGR02444 family protein [Alteromonas sp. 5E99-2]
MCSDGFWSFSLQVYSQPQVSEHCLYLQDNHGCNVNLLLFCCWLHSLKRSLSVQALTTIANEIRDHDLKIKAHRAKRIQNKHSSIYETFKKEELVMEKEQQSLISNAYHQGCLEADDKSNPIDSFIDYYSLSQHTVNNAISPIRLAIN